MFRLSLKRPLRKAFTERQDAIAPTPVAKSAAKPISPTFRFNPRVKLDTTQVTDLRPLRLGPPPAAPPNPGRTVPAPKPMSEDALAELAEITRYSQIAKDLGTKLQATDYLPLTEVVRLQFLAKAQGKSFYDLYHRVAGRRRA